MFNGLNRSDGTMTDLQDKHWVTLRPVYILKTHHHAAYPVYTYHSVIFKDVYVFHN